MCIWVEAISEDSLPNVQESMVPLVRADNQIAVDVITSIVVNVVDLNTVGEMGAKSLFSN